MSDTINELYLNYVDAVGGTLENDRYFQYLFEMVQSGDNTLHQTAQILHKVVDERWLSTIEESLDAINNIIEKPRRFITTSEEVVPVALAKKITADSVRHLSMNTQFIASNEDGDIQPTRVLNVTTEESYDLYENRFIYHLIQRLVTFIDKRTDVIFWSTGDEKRNTLTMTSKVDDAYEEIEYKLEMKIKNRQSFAENDSDNMQVFMRIDRVRRLVLALRGSAFCSLMAGCATVKSPIHRTNLMMKDPDYRTCYKLWQFLESYDEVGYRIEVQDSAMAFDEDYVFQLYTNLITNYTVFKSLMEEDSRDMEEIVAEKREVIEPKFIKEIVEEIVDDYNIPDVEVRQVIIEEVTERQLELEKELEEEKQKREEAEQARDESEIRREQEVWQMRADLQAQAEAHMKEQRELEQKAADAEKNLQETIEKSQAELEAVKKEAGEQIEKTLADSRAEIEKTKAESQAEIEKIQTDAAAEIEKTKAESRNAIEKMQTETRAEIEKTRTESQDAIEKIQSETRAEIEKTRTESQDAIEKIQSDSAAEIEKTRAESKKQVEKAKADAAAEIARTKANLRQVQKEASEELEKTKADSREEIARMQETSRTETEKLKEAACLEIEKIREEMRLEMERVKEAARLEVEAARESEQKALQQAEVQALARQKLEEQEKERQLALWQKEQERKAEEERKHLEEEKRQQKLRDILQKASENTDANFTNVTEKLSRRNQNIRRKRK